jgi:hypothetical protein
MYCFLQSKGIAMFNENEVDPPDELFNKALLSGIIFSNTTNLKDGSYVPFFEINNEKAFLWKPKEFNYNVLIVEISPLIKVEKFWRTLAIILEFTMAYSSLFEVMMECDYNWMKNFHPNIREQELEFLELNDDSARFSGLIREPEFIKEFSPFIELLHRDELFYCMWMNLNSSFNSHHFCLRCANELEGYQMHPNHEIPIWQRAQAVPAMEIAIVQSTRAVEAALGKPGKKEQRVLERWKSAITIEPFDEFPIARMNYLDYYKKMFKVRGDAAHSLGELPYDVRRAITIEAQCFAFEIMSNYYQKNRISTAKAVTLLNLNTQLIIDNNGFTL